LEPGFAEQRGSPPKRTKVGINCLESLNRLIPRFVTTTARKDTNLKTLLKYSLLALALALSTNVFAQQGGWGGNGGNGGNGGWNSPPPGRPPSNNNIAPEVDPSLALSGFTLLGGALTVLRSRRRK